MYKEHNVERNEKVDLLKGIAIVLMVMGHSMNDIDYMKIPFNVIYSFHMPLLFFLSGYVLELTKSKYEQMGIVYFIKRKTMSLLIPYFSWTVLVPWIYNKCSVEVLGNQRVSVTGIHGGGIWFLPVLFGLTLMYTFLWQLQRNFMKKRWFCKGCSSLVDIGNAISNTCVINQIPVYDKHDELCYPFFFGVFVTKYNFLEKLCILELQFFGIYAKRNHIGAEF